MKLHIGCGTRNLPGWKLLMFEKLMTTLILWAPQMTFHSLQIIPYTDDLADACVFLMETNYCDPQFLNVGIGSDLTIRELAENIKDVVGYQGELRFDVSRPDGMPRKVLDVSRINALGWKAKTSLQLGLEKTYRYFLEH